MAKLTICRGLPASGKTTFARELVNSSGNTVRVNRDDLRAMCFNSKWTGKRERQIVKIEKALVAEALSEGYSVVIDDTNLSGAEQMWKDFGKSWVDVGVDVEVKDFTSVPLSTCIERDALRDKPVGPGVIYRMAGQAGLLPWTGRPIVICDIDGTVANLNHRLKHLQKEPKNYEEFFNGVIFDAPYWEVIYQIQDLAKTHDVVFVSGRPDTCSAATCEWLYSYRLPYVAVLMRRGGDHRPDDLIKEELLKFIPKDKVVLVVDDRPRVISMWQRHGLNVQAVHQENWVGRE